MSNAEWTAIVLAGDRPGEHGFASGQGVEAKALIRVAGEPMLGRVVQTLLDCSSIGRVVILAQRPDALVVGDLAWMRDERAISLANSGDGISSSIAALAGSERAPYPALITTADHPLLTVPMIEAFLSGAADADVAVGLVERDTIQAAYPHSRRTWLKFSDGAYSGANLFALRTPATQAALELWSSVEQDRKKVRRLVMHFGPLLALRALTRTISLDAGLARIAGRLGLSARAVRLPFAEAAMDVDKPSDLELAEQILGTRESTAA